jgi:hypothetical protein
MPERGLAPRKPLDGARFAQMGRSARTGLPDGLELACRLLPREPG